MLFYVDVIKMEISCLSAGKSCEVQDLCASFRACAACRAVQRRHFPEVCCPGAEFRDFRSGNSSIRSGICVY